ncbi:related to cytochrome p450 [Rhynchosporium agropyri]|uniref:Related to cytochrome p450 n=1 Tax=Rhynchosporium agropyri TaxID=914238 RepID=A0A1E1KD21_9HELO|nr:related to cytochrome p450 [Rhynchosporium agropyri]
MLSFTLIGVISIVLAIVYAGFREQKRKRVPTGTRPLPGPRGLPFIGRVHDVPAVATWLKFWEWSKVYGPIYQMEIFGSVHVWISSEEVANDLLSKRGTIYSDRPTIPNLPDNRTSGNYLALLGRTETWKRQRKVSHQVMSRPSAESLYNYPYMECKRLLYQMSKEPSNYIAHIEQYTSRTISRISWGAPHFADELRLGTFGLLTTISPSGAVPNIVSWLSYLPAWLSPWQQVENARHAREHKFFRHCYDTVKSKIANGIAAPSYMKVFLDEKEKGKHEMRNEEGQYIVGMVAIAGALTIGSPLQSYILAMCHYPEWQSKLREEMREVCGERCPEWEDREKLPMLRAVMKEVVRWRPPVPTGIPHCLEKDDIYNGYHIPAGATIHALEWGITRDPLIYPDPESFLPNRWLSPSFPTTYREPLSQFPTLKAHSQFGFGRRACTGVDIVEQELFLAMGGLAWAFDVQKKTDKEGKEIEVPLAKYTSLLIAKPEKFEFECRVMGRNGMDGDTTKGMLEKMWKDVNEGRTEDWGPGEENVAANGLVFETTGEQILHLGTPDMWLSERDSGSDVDEVLVEKEVLLVVEDVKFKCPGGWK